MSDKEIELWEEKSKEGLLHNDANITSFLGDMRMVLYSSVEGAGLSLYDIGIETSDNWRDNGKLVIDEDVLKSMAATNPDAICKLFTDMTRGWEPACRMPLRTQPMSAAEAPAPWCAMREQRMFLPPATPSMRR